jgi:hypothetical protein
VTRFLLSLAAGIASAALSIWVFGTSWWSWLLAALCVVATMAPALRKRPEVTDA